MKSIMALSGLLLCATSSHAAGTVGPGVPNFTVRDGYSVTLVGQDLGETRFIEPGAAGTLYLSQPNTGSIATLKKQTDGTYKKLADFTSGKKTVHGMDYHDGWLWFTQSGVVWKGRDTNGDGKADEEIKVTDDLPEGGGHWWRSILVGSDGFYTSIGESQNISDETATDRQKIWKYSLDGKTRTLWSSGIRNTEKLRFRPGTTEVYGCDHGSDWYGKPLGETNDAQPVTNRKPDDEFNHYVEGGFYGHPFIVSDGSPRLEYKDRPDILELAAKTILPAWPVGPHWATNGFTFATTDKIGAKGDAFIACHGSWNSSVKQGYCIDRVMFDSETGKPMGAMKMVSTLDGQNVLARPVDCAEETDGSLLFTVDGGKMYRLSKNQQSAPRTQFKIGG